MSKERKVVATMTEEECAVFEDMRVEEKAINDILEEIIKHKKKLIKKGQQEWDKLNDKYDLPDESLSLDKNTGEIFIND